MSNKEKNDSELWNVIGKAEKNEFNDNKAPIIKDNAGTVNINYVASKPEPKSINLHRNIWLSLAILLIAITTIATIVSRSNPESSQALSSGFEGITDCGIKIKYPKDWKPELKKNFWICSLSIFPENNSKSDTKISIRVEELSGEMRTLENYVNQLKKAFKN